MTFATRLAILRALVVGVVLWCPDLEVADANALGRVTEVADLLLTERSENPVVALKLEGDLVGQPGATVNADPTVPLSVPRAEPEPARA